MDVADPVGEGPRVDVLEQVPSRSRRHRGEDLGVVGKARQHEDPHRGRRIDQTADRPDTVATRHDEVKEHDVR